MNLVNDGFYGKAAALTTVLLAVSLGVLGVARGLVGRKIDLFQAQ
jgi:ABC-type Fe3+ transport system permease subunit